MYVFGPSHGEQEEMLELVVGDGNALPPPQVAAAAHWTHTPIIAK